MKPIYLYHLTQNNLVRYVGVTTNPSIRKYEHKREKPTHTFEIIDTFTDKQEAGIAEQYHIAGYKTHKDGWNKSIGGELLLSGENHPRWIDGLSILDRKAYDKKYNKEYFQRAEVIAKRREREQSPEYKAKKREYDKTRWLAGIKR